ncbi:DAK2 domain-containing protein [Gemmatimonadota bacterium]
MNRISYLDGPRFFNAIAAGARTLTGEREYLNRINVYPVPDGDTGNNMTVTIASIVEETTVQSSLQKTADSIADAALVGARGNSGLILAQYFYGISREVAGRERIETRSLGDLFTGAVRYAREAIGNPVEGTVLTVIEEWSTAFRNLQEKYSDLAELLPASLEAARSSLQSTTSRLKALRDANVVDAGGKGFVALLEGASDFIRRGRLRNFAEPAVLPREFADEHSIHHGEVNHRYCTEAVLAGEGLDLPGLRRLLASSGDSVIVSGHERKIHFHLHTNRPAELFRDLDPLGSFQRPKIDDMLRQVEAGGSEHPRIALVTDTTCDLPCEILDRYNIHMVPVQLSFGDSHYLDRFSITPDIFYRKLAVTDSFPTTSQPPVRTFEGLFSFLGEHYDSIISINLSSGLSGTLNAARTAAERIESTPVTVIDSRTLTASLGLIVLNAAEAIDRGDSHDEVVEIINDSITRSRLLVGARTLKYFIRGGRISPVQGLVGNFLNLKPIVTLDREGKGATFGRSHSQRGTLRNIEQEIDMVASSRGIDRYAVVHAAVPEEAADWAGHLAGIVGKTPEYVIDISPVIGLHAGTGALGICFLEDRSDIV